MSQKKLIQCVFVLLCIIMYSCSFMKAYTGWNKNNRCITTVSTQKLASLNRYVSCCQFAYQIPHNPLYNTLYDYFQKEKVISIQPFKHRFEKHYVAGYILSFPEETVIAFRGTIIDGNIRRELWNNINNQITVQTFGIPVGIHTGVWNEYQNIRDDFLQQFVKLEDRKVPIVFTGHSLGGAMCQIAALEMVSSTKSGVECVTFGAYKIVDDPKIFDKFNIENIRVRFKNDYVSYYPLSNSFQHAHTQDILFYHKNKIEHRVIYYKQFIQQLLEGTKGT